MGNDNLPQANNSPIPALLNQLGVSPITTDDELSIEYRKGMLNVQVKRQDGKTETVRRTVSNGGFTQMAQFNPDQMSKVERDELIRELYKNGEKQPSLAKKFGKSQALISKIVNQGS